MGRLLLEIITPYRRQSFQ